MHSTPETSSHGDGQGFGPTRTAGASSGWSTSVGTSRVVFVENVLVGGLRTENSCKVLSLTTRSNLPVIPKGILRRRGEYRHKARAVVVLSPAESPGWRPRWRIYMRCVRKGSLRPYFLGCSNIWKVSEEWPHDTSKVGA